MRDTLIQVSYLVASVLFILGLRSLTRPDKARNGMQMAAIGMLCVAGIATGAWTTDISTHLIEGNVSAHAIWGVVVVGFGLVAGTLRRRQPQELFA